MKQRPEPVKPITGAPLIANLLKDIINQSIGGRQLSLRDAESILAKRDKLLSEVNQICSDYNELAASTRVIMKHVTLG